MSSRNALVQELLARYRELSEAALCDFEWPEQRRDHRAGDHNDLMVAVYDLELRSGGRSLPWARELEEADLTSAGSALHDGLHALLVADLVNEEDFAFLTDPLSALLGVDLASRHRDLRPPGAPEPGPLVPYDAPSVDPLPDHPLWAHTRDMVDGRLAAIFQRDGADVYVVDLHLDVDWFDFDARAAGIEIRWNTHRRLDERRRRWKPHPDVLAIDPDAADALPWDWVAFRGGGPDDALWKHATDPAGHALLADYGQRLDLWYSDEELARDEDDELLDVQGELTECLAAGLPAPVRALHADGVIARIFGRPIPITFSAQDSHFPAWELGRAANPPELYAEFGPTQVRYWDPG